MSYINSKRELKHGTPEKQCNEETCLTSDKIKITERWIKYLWLGLFLLRQIPSLPQQQFIHFLCEMYVRLLLYQVFWLVKLEMNERHSFVVRGVELPIKHDNFVNNRVWLKQEIVFSTKQLEMREVSIQQYQIQQRCADFYVLSVKMLNNFLIWLNMFCDCLFRFNFSSFQCKFCLFY